MTVQVPHESELRLAALKERQASGLAWRSGEEVEVWRSDVLRGPDGETHEVAVYGVGSGNSLRFRAECEHDHRRSSRTTWPDRTLTRWATAHVEGRAAVFERLRPEDFHPARAHYGPVEAVVGTGRARCRVCAQKIAKGEPALKVAHDFQGGGSWTAITVQAHRRCVEPSGGIQGSRAPQGEHPPLSSQSSEDAKKVV